MKRLILAIITALMTAIGVWAIPTVYVLRIDDEIDNKTWHYTRQAVREAREKDAIMFVLHLNTYGGAVDAADSIRTALMALPMKTMAYVDHNAASAGAMIALACDTVIMSPGSSMGASSVVNQAGEVMPDKYQSYMKSIMRSTAESHGKYFDATDSVWRWRRDPAIAEAMVRPDSVLSFTATEAVAHGYAEGIEPTLDKAILRYVDYAHHTAYYEPSATDSFLGFLAGAGVRALLIMLIIGGIYMEMHSPGLGVAAAVAIVAAALYFLPMLVTGTMATWVIVLFIAGIVLLVLEIFVIPGFGVCGVTGIFAILVSLAGAMVNSDSINGEYTTDIVTSVTVTFIGLLLAIAAVWFLTSKYGPQCVRRVTELQKTQQVSDGYIGVDASEAQYVGHEATAVTDMRPSGKIRIDGGDGLDHDAVSLSGYIDAGHRVKIVRFENAQLYVQTVREA